MAKRHTARKRSVKLSSKRIHIGISKGHRKAATGAKGKVAKALIRKHTPLRKA